MLNGEAADMCIRKFLLTSMEAEGSVLQAQTWEGALPRLMRRFRDTGSERAKRYYGQFLADRKCSACSGARLRPESAAVLLGGISIVERCGPERPGTPKHRMGQEWRRTTSRSSCGTEPAPRSVARGDGHELGLGLEETSR